jgi:hypothetical protein
MAALDFPSSPTNGQVYGAYTYDSTKGAWNVTPQTQASVTTSDTPPVNPVSGDQWFYTVDGTMFVYYSDGTSSQWVEQPKSVAGGYSYYRSPNFLINGGFDIWQRGTSSTTNTVYLADRWVHLWSAGTHTVSRSTDVPDATLQYSLSFASTSGTTPIIRQYVESVNALALAGQTVTLSIWAKSTVGTGALNWTTAIPAVTDTYGTVVNDQTGVFAATMTVGTWTRYSATFTVGAGAVRGYLVQVFRNVATTSTTTLYAGAQLEIGTAVTSFRRNAPSIQAELAACQRYYASMTTGVAGVGLFSGFAFSTVNALVTLVFPVTMRSTPVLVLSSASHFSTSSPNGTGLTTTAITLGGTSTITSRLNINVASGYTAGQGTFLATASTSAVLAFNSEL